MSVEIKPGWGLWQSPELHTEEDDRGATKEGGTRGRDDAEDEGERDWGFVSQSATACKTTPNRSFPSIHEDDDNLDDVTPEDSHNDDHLSTSATPTPCENQTIAFRARTKHVSASTLRCTTDEVRRPSNWSGISVNIGNCNSSRHFDSAATVQLVDTPRVSHPDSATNSRSHYQVWRSREDG
ncbi:hypothetical protein NMY22_g3880 [Coprinellus aureogranulatus]|nr:hypothetical protein NMY22_g3880 [Coprinellus aureogranulatus]